MNPKRRLAVLALLAGLSISSQAVASNFPHKPLRLVVIVAPGGSGDSVARILSDGLSQKLGQPVIVENKPGAGGNLATQIVAKAPADGHTLLLTANNHTINPVLFNNAGYELEDFVPVAPLMVGPSIIAVPADSPYHTLGDLISHARKAPDTIAYGSAGIGTPSHIAGELLQREADIKLTHVAYRGSGPSMADAVGGQIPVVISTLVAAVPHIESGRLRGLAVTSKQRWQSAPQIPAASEFGLSNYEHLTWLGLFAPKDTPTDVVEFLNKEVIAVLQQANIKEMIEKQGGHIGNSDAAQFAFTIEADSRVSSKLVTEANLKAE